MDTARIVELIETTLQRRGSGSQADPIRVVTQYWTKEGVLLFSLDPVLEMAKVQR